MILPNVRKLQSIVEKELSSLENLVILKNGRNYDVFGAYKIMPKKDYVILEKRGDFVGRFSSIRIALGWCTADKFSQYAVRDEIKILDNQVQLLTTTYRIRLAVAHKIVIKDKVDQRRYKLNEVKTRLERCITLAKYWQTKGFDNETQRIRTSTYTRSSSQSI